MAYAGVRNYYGGLAGVSDATLGVHVTNAQQRVADDGVAATDSHYDQLVALMAGVYMQPAGLISGQLVEKRVADVMAKHADNSGSAKSQPTLLDSYRMVLGATVGIGHRFSGVQLDGT